MELTKQRQYAPLAIAEMAVSLFAADRGYLDDVDTDKVGAFEEALHAYMRADHAALMDEMDESADYNDDVERRLKQALEAFKASGAW